jgi:hypothetical protein
MFFKYLNNLSSKSSPDRINDIEELELIVVRRNPKLIVINLCLSRDCIVLKRGDNIPSLIIVLIQSFCDLWSYGVASELVLHVIDNVFNYGDIGGRETGSLGWWTVENAVTVVCANCINDVCPLWFLI